MANGTYFYREKKETDYTMMDNTFLRDKELSAKAKGIFAYILSLPDSWKINMTEIQDHFTDWLDSIKAWIRELKKSWYLNQEQKRSESWVFWDCIYFVIEKPKVEKPLADNPPAGKPLAVKPLTGNPPLLNTNNSNNWFISITEDINSEESKEIIIIEQKTPLQSKIEEFEKFRKEIKKPFTTTGKNSFLSRLSELSEWDDGIAIRILDTSMANNWQGIFPEERRSGTDRRSGGKNLDRMEAMANISIR